MRTPVSGYSNHFTTAHGTVFVYTGSAAGTAILTSLARVEQAKRTSMQQTIDALGGVLNGSDSGGVSLLAITLSGLVAGASLAATVAGATASAAGAASGIAGLFGRSQPEPIDILEIDVENLGSSPLVLSSYANTNANATKALKPLNSGAADTMVFADVGSNTTLTLNFAYGITDIESAGQDSIYTVSCAISRPGNWQIAVGIDGSNPAGNSSSQALAVSFVPNPDSNMEGVTVAAYVTETATAELSLVFLPAAVYG